MRNVLTIVRERRSVRDYQDRGISADVVEELKEAMIRSPSSRGLRPWRFVFVSDRDKLAELSRAKAQYSGFLARAPLGVVVCGDATASDAWIEDCSIAAIILQLTATSLGLGSCWIQIRMRPHDLALSAEEFVRTALELPEEYRVECIVSVGYPKEVKPPVEGDRLKWDAIVDL